uniref:Uncharacterized protein n=1 Tax=Meloidogyne hapla TaxID=6305 RepID=A0A1I8BRS0_MELHA
MNNNNFFSETEKSDEIIVSTNGHNLQVLKDDFELLKPNLDEIELMEERCSELWSQIKDANVLNGSEFSKRLDTEDNEDFSSELEEGPDPKRRKTLEIKIEEKTFSYLPINTNIPLRQSNLNDLLATNTTFVMDGVRQEQQQILPLGSDIGYSSGENSVHEVIANTKSPGDYQEKDADSPLWAAHIAQSNELEKSFYRTVPLDDYGMTDLDTDDGGLGQRGNYLTREFLQDFEEKIGQGRLELTDSLIVHVDAPENRPLNEFEEVMDLFGKDKLFVNSGQPFSEDDCESLSTFAENEAVVREKRKINNRKRHTSEKRSLKTPSLFNKNEVKQNRSRKWTDTRYIRRNFTAYNAGGHLSNDFEWDDDAFIGYQTVPDDFFDKLPDIVSDKEFVESRKAFSTFYDNFRQDLAESQNLSGRLRELVTLVGKSLDDTSFLLRELHSTFESISFHCHELGEKFKENRNNSFNSSKNINSNLILLQQLINTLENTSEKLSILLKKQRLTEANSNYINNDYLNKLAKECSGIIEELKELKNK